MQLARPHALALALSAMLAGCGAPALSERPLSERLGGDEAVARETIRELVARGPDAIPELQTALESDDPTVTLRARTALGRITGQWGSGDGLIWERSVEAAANPDTPLMVLQLFGNFDEEHC